MDSSHRPIPEHSATTPSAELDFIGLHLIGDSPRFLQSLNLVRKVAVCDAPVLIQGETGTGKELAARAIHYLGARRQGPFIPVNCGAVPDTLIESELFGHARGAFTDAREARPGVIAQARGGTLFLDELEALSGRGQVALLRFLQDRTYRPLGGTLVTDANVRIIAASNTDLHARALEGAYRADLLFRLNVIVIEMPPLRDRGADVLLLADQFLLRFSRQYRIAPKTLDARARAYLRSHAWPGNVRELENVIHRECLLTEGPVISFERLAGQDARAAVTRTPDAPWESFRQAKARAIASFEREYLSELLRIARGNISLASRLSGKERSRLGKLVRKHGLSGAGVQRRE